MKSKWLFCIHASVFSVGTLITPSTLYAQQTPPSLNPGDAGYDALADFGVYLSVVLGTHLREQERSLDPTAPDNQIDFNPGSNNILTFDAETSEEHDLVNPEQGIYPIPDDLGGGSFVSIPEDIAPPPGGSVQHDPCHAAQPSLTSLGKRAIDWLVPAAGAVTGDYGLAGSINDNAGNPLGSASISLQDPEPEPDSAGNPDSRPFTPGGPVIMVSDPSGQFAGPVFDAPLLDTFPGTLAISTGWTTLTQPAHNHLVSLDNSISSGTGVPGCGTSSLCTDKERFQVEVEWQDFTGTGSPATGVTTDPITNQFFFFDEKNWEVLVKVLDGCEINNRFWVFAAATTDVEYTLTVTDTRTGQENTFNPPSEIFADGFESGDTSAWSDAVTDTSAFATCP